MSVLKKLNKIKKIDYEDKHCCGETKVESKPKKRPREKKSKKKPVSSTTILIGPAKLTCSMRVLAQKAPYFRKYQDRAVIRLPAKKVSLKAFTVIYDWMSSGIMNEDCDKLEDVAFAAYFLGISINIWGPCLIKGVEKRNNAKK